MNYDTPLPEVAHHLPVAAARMLGVEHPVVQESTLVHIRSLVSFMEEEGVELDPIQYTKILECLTVFTIEAVRSHFEVCQELALAQADLKRGG
jgi:hypothetical protein